MVTLFYFKDINELCYAKYLQILKATLKVSLLFYICVVASRGTQKDHLPMSVFDI